nr:hypothetical protein [Salmonella enterica]
MHHSASWTANTCPAPYFRRSLYDVRWQHTGASKNTVAP